MSFALLRKLRYIELSPELSIQDTDEMRMYSKLAKNYYIRIFVQ